MNGQHRQHLTQDTKRRQTKQKHATQRNKKMSNTDHGLEPIANLRGNITANLNGEVKLTILRKHEN